MLQVLQLLGAGAPPARAEGPAPGPLSLAAAYELALREAPGLRVHTRLAFAKQQLPRQARAQLRPQLSAAASAALASYSVTYREDAVEEKIRHHALQVLQPLYRPDLWEKVDQAVLQAEAARLQLQLEEQKLGSQVVAVYFEVLLHRQAVELAERRLEARRHRQEKMEGFLARGLATRVDALEAVVQHDRARAELLEAGNRLHLSRLALGHLIGVPEPDLPAVHPAAPGSVQQPGALAEWDERLDGNLELRLAKAGLAMAEAEARLRRRERYPKLDARLSYSDSDSSEITARKDDFRAVLELNIPLYQGGYDAAREQEARHQVAAAREEIELTRRKTRQELQTAWTGYGSAVQRLAMLGESLRSARFYLDTAETARRAGLQEMLRVLEARIRVAEVELEIVQALHDLALASLGLRRAVGEMTLENLGELSQLLAANLQGTGDPR